MSVELSVFAQHQNLFKVEKIEQIKELIIKNSLNNIIIYSQKTFPNESCGFLLEDGGIHPAFNAVNELHDYSLTTRNSFMIDNESWKNVQLRNSPIIGIYHSHTNGVAQMSLMDKTFLIWPNLCYVIVGLLDSNPVQAKLFWWEQKNLKELELQF